MLLVVTTYAVGAVHWMVIKLCAPCNVNQKQPPKGRKRGEEGVILTLVAIASHENLLRTLSRVCRCKVMRTTAREKQGRDAAPEALGNTAKAAGGRGHRAGSGKQAWSCDGKPLATQKATAPGHAAGTCCVLFINHTATHWGGKQDTFLGQNIFLARWKSVNKTIKLFF